MFLPLSLIIGQFLGQFALILKITTLNWFYWKEICYTVSL